MLTANTFPGRTMQTVDFPLSTEYIELHKLLKLIGLADTGGEGKALVAAGAVSVDGKPESRKAAKIRAGQVVSLEGVKIRVVAAVAADTDGTAVADGADGAAD